RCSTSSSPLSLFIVFVYSDLHHPYLHSFPTRRSSDLQFLRRQESQQSKLIINQKSNIMNTITKLVVLISLCLITGTSHAQDTLQDRKSTRLNSSHVKISYAVFCLKKKKSKRSQPIGVT